MRQGGSELVVSGEMSAVDETRTGCIYEPLSPIVLESTPDARVSWKEYSRVRSSWPLSQSVLFDILLCDRIQTIVNALIDDDPRLFNEQYIIKPSNSGVSGAFDWHRDSDSLHSVGVVPQDVSYISIWIAMDDTTEDNGCLVVRPQNGLGAEIALELDRGSAVVMSHLVYHKSGPNHTNFQRRAWMPQFSRGRITDATGSRPLSLAIAVSSASER